jgi:hypothetical protein
MPPLMDLVAGDRREILLVLAVEDWDAFADPGRFPSHLALGGGLDPTWLDLFSEAARRVTGRPDPVDFLDARLELRDAVASERTVERIDAGWIAAVAALRAAELDAVAGRWIDLLEEDLGLFAAEEKPWIRELVGQLVGFARSAAGAPDVLFAWSL